jgi:hypothetical protein
MSMPISPAKHRAFCLLGSQTINEKQSLHSEPFPPDQEEVGSCPEKEAPGAVKINAEWLS